MDLWFGSVFQIKEKLLSPEKKSKNYRKKKIFALHTCTFKLCWMMKKGLWIVGKEGKKEEPFVTVVCKFLIGMWV